MREAIVDSLVDRFSGLRYIFESDDLPEGETIVASKLSAEMRLLHHIIARILLPKTDCFDLITKRELLVMVSLVQHTPVYLPVLMVHQMMEASISQRLCLPYGMGLTLLFRAYGVVLDDKPY